MKKGVLNSKQRGFTIIEVTLVLAIAGLIFLMVFVALPGLRASQRDAERREDIAMLLETVKKYQTNNRGALPGASDNSTLEHGNKITIDYASAKNTIESSSNKSQYDTKWNGFYYAYLGEKFVDPSGENYKLTVLACGSKVADADCANNSAQGPKALGAMYNANFPNSYQVYVVTQAACKGDRAIRTSNPRKLAVLYKLEGAGVYCSNT